MSLKVRKGICYLYFVLFFLYFGAVGVYYYFQTAEAFRLWEFMIFLSGPISMFFLLSVVEDTKHNTYKLLTTIFAAACMVTTMEAHTQSVFIAPRVASFQTNDYLAWGVFFGAACLCAAPSIGKGDENRKQMRIICMIIGTMCFMGLLGPLTHIDMLWFIAIAGFGPGAMILSIVQLKYLKQ